MAKSKRQKSKSELILAVKKLKGLACPQEVNSLKELVLYQAGETIFHDETKEETVARLEVEAAVEAKKNTKEED